MSGVARPGSRSNACAGTSYARANLAGAGDVWELVLPAVFKTVCGALLRRPGWVRFPSIPAKFRRFDSQDDSHSRERRHMLEALDGRAHPPPAGHCTSIATCCPGHQAIAALNRTTPPSLSPRLAAQVMLNP